MHAFDQRTDRRTDGQTDVDSKTVHIHEGLLGYTWKHREIYSKITRNLNEIFHEIFNTTKVVENGTKTCISIDIIKGLYTADIN